ncbi:hypothetical protein L9F63_023064, partial [Diploptera punctata]
VQVYKDFKLFSIICTFLGLAPYKIHINNITGDGRLDARIGRNVAGIICTFLMTCVMLYGMYDMIMEFKFQRKSTVSDTLSTKFCMPMFFAVTIVALLMNSTVIKYKMSQLFNIFSNIDKEINRLRGEPVLEKSVLMKMLSNFDIVILLFLFAPYLIYDALIWGIGFFHMNSYLLRFSEFVNIVIVMLYCRCVLYVWKKLSELCEILSKTLECDTLTGYHTGLGYKILQVHPESKMKRIQDFTEIVVSLRRLYSQVCAAVHIINAMYGFIVLLEIATHFSVIITNVSTVMSLINTKEEHNIIPHHPPDHKPLFSNTACLIISASLLVTMIVICHITTSKSKDLASVVGKVSLKYPLNIVTLQQLKLFSYQIRYNCFDFTAFWLFRLDSNLLCTIFASAVTYTAVLSQLN